MIRYRPGLCMPSMGRNPCFIRQAHNFSRFSAQINRDSHRIKKDKQGLLVRRKILWYALQFEIRIRGVILWLSIFSLRTLAMGDMCYNHPDQHTTILFNRYTDILQGSSIDIMEPSPKIVAKLTHRSNETLTLWTLPIVLYAFSCTLIVGFHFLSQPFEKKINCKMKTLVIPQKKQWIYHLA